jgi:hypothetical protein
MLVPRVRGVTARFLIMSKQNFTQPIADSETPMVTCCGKHMNITRRGQGIEETQPVKLETKHTKQRRKNCGRKFQTCWRRTSTHRGGEHHQGRRSGEKIHQKNHDVITAIASGLQGSNWNGKSISSSSEDVSDSLSSSLPSLGARCR